MIMKTWSDCIINYLGRFRFSRGAWTLGVWEITIPLFAYFVNIRQILTFHS